MSGAAVMAMDGGAFVPTTVINSAAGSGTETVPIGATNVVIEVWGSAGAGGRRHTVTACTFTGGAGGGSGGYARTSIACSGGQTINWTAGVKGTTPAPDASNGSAGAASSASSGTLTITTMTANGGGGGSGGPGSTPGTGGTASGGTQANTSGNNGTTGGACTSGVGGAGVAGVNAGPFGTGGHGDPTLNSGELDGAVVFRYT